MVAATLADNGRPPHQRFGVSHSASKLVMELTAPDHWFDGHKHCGLKSLAYRH